MARGLPNPILLNSLITSGSDKSVLPETGCNDTGTTDFLEEGIRTLRTASVRVDTLRLQKLVLLRESGRMRGKTGRSAGKRGQPDQPTVGKQWPPEARGASTPGLSRMACRVWERKDQNP